MSKQAAGCVKRRWLDAMYTSCHMHACCLSVLPPQERHGRLAAALALSELTQERDIQGVVAKWGREGFVSKGELRLPAV